MVHDGSVSERVVELLWERDPVFRALASDVVGVEDVSGFMGAVYGGDVSKMSPEPSEVGFPSGVRPRRRRRRTSGDVGKSVELGRKLLRGVDAARRNYRKVAEPLARRVGVATGVTPGPMRAASAAGGVWDRAVSQNEGFRNASKWVALGAGGVGAAAVGSKGKKLWDEAQMNRPPRRAEVPGEYPGTLGKADDPSLDAEVEISKVDAEKRQVFGWASVTHRNGRPVIDKQGDFIELDEVEKSAYDYVVKSRVGGRQHRRDDDGKPFHAADLIESFVVTPDKVEKMGMDPDKVPHGWWVGFKVNDDDTWDAVKSGKVTGFSVHGRGKREVLEGEMVPAEAVVQS